MLINYLFSFFFLPNITSTTGLTKENLNKLTGIKLNVLIPLFVKLLKFLNAGAFSVKKDPLVLYNIFEAFSIDLFNGINKAIINKDFSFSNMQFKGEKLEAIRKLSLVLLDDAKSTEPTPVKDRFMEFADDETKERIKNIAENTPTSKTLDITEDQSISLEDAITIGAISYPLSTDPDSVYGFLKKLRTIFNWDIYEADDLGRGNSIRHFSYLVSGWMEGNGLNQIIKRTTNKITNNP